MPAADRRIVAALTAAFVFLGLAFAIATPMFENYDEQTHIDRARYTARHPLERPGPGLRRTFGAWAAEAALGIPEAPSDADWERLPDERPPYRRFDEYPGGDAPQHEGCPGPCQNYQYTQPPGWYLLVAPVAGVLDDRPFPTVVAGLRIVDVLMAAATIPLTWAFALQLWPARRRRAIAATAITAVFGPLAYMASGVNNDALVIPAAAATLAVAAAILRRAPTTSRALLLGLAVTVGLLAKIELAIIGPLAALTLLVRPRIKPMVIAGLAAAPGVAYWAYVYVTEGVLSPESSELLAPERPGPWSSATFLPYALSKVPTLAGRFWGMYGFPVVVLPAVVRVACSLGAVVLVLAWLLRKRWRRPVEWRWLLLAAVPFALALAILWASFVTYRMNGEVRGLAPRYLYTAAPVLATAAVAGARHLLGRRPWFLPAGMVVTAVTAGLGSFAYAFHRLYGTWSTAEALRRADVVGPLGSTAPWLAACLAGFVASVAVAATEARKLHEPQPDAFDGELPHA